MIHQKRKYLEHLFSTVRAASEELTLYAAKLAIVARFDYHLERSRYGFRRIVYTIVF